MAPPKASAEEIRAFIDQYPLWSVEDSKLHREYAFDNFVQAFGFMTQVALIAERANHHPEWFNVYRKVVIDLSTHEAGGITELDFDLGRKMEAIATALIAV